MTTHTEDPRFQRDVYSVSRLNSEVRAVLEGSFPLLWVEGEISNLARPASGHIYFSLKDPQAQVRCAMFRMKRQRLRFDPDNGQKVLIRARVGLYEGRGEFQLIVEHMEPAGEGALRLAFEALKQQLASEGLFDAERKQPLPRHPGRLGIITSPSGAAIRDVLSVLKRRHAAIETIIYPVPVQGEEAPRQIAEMIRIADRRGECDALILTRGGGSLEDLMAFNDEQVARAIAAARTPLVSAVGHEIDFTIADFVADYRAPTPSAAAELLSPDAQELAARLHSLQSRLSLQIRQRLSGLALQCRHLDQRLHRAHPGVRLSQQQQRLDELELRLSQALQYRIERQTHHLSTLASRLQAQSPGQRIRQLRQRCDSLAHRLAQAVNSHHERRQQRFAAMVAKLNALSPLATLGRGYSITFNAADGRVVHDSSDLSAGQLIETRLSRGSLISRVEQCLKEQQAE